MDQLEKLASFAKLSVAGLADQATLIDPAVFAMVFGILFLFAVASRSWSIIVGSTLLAAIGYFLLVAPNSATPLLAMGGWLGSLLISYGGIQTRRREKTQRHDFEKLSEAVRNLEAVSGRRLLQSLNLPSRETAQPDEHDDLR